MRPSWLRSRGRLHLFVLLLYSGMALIATWPLAAHFTTHVPGDGIDDPALTWNLWWARYRLIDQLNPDLFHVDWMFHPIQINLAFYTLTPLNGLLSTPLQVATSLVVATNIILLGSFILAGYGGFLLTFDLLATLGARRGERLNDANSARRGAALFVAAIFAGMVYAFASSKLFYAALGQFNIASSQWIPFSVLYVLRLARARNSRDALVAGAMAGLFLGMQAWAELTYATFLLLFFALAFLWHSMTILLRRGAGAQDPPVHTRWRSWLILLAGFVAAGFVFLIFLAPVLWAMLPEMRAEGDFFARGGGFSDVFSADLAGFLIPTRLHPLFGQWVATLPFPNDKGQQIFLGYAVLILGGAGLIWLWRRHGEARRQFWLWGASALFFWLLTLGPAVRIWGQALPIPGPFLLVSQLPFFSGNRYPSRYSVMLMLVAAVLAGIGILWLLSARTWRRSAVIVGVVFVFFWFEHLSAPLPLSNLQAPPIYARLAQDSSPDGVLLELPTGWRNGARVLGKSDILIMMQQYYQTVHGERRLAGNTSRNPDYKFQYFSQAPVIGHLIALMNADQGYMTAQINELLPAWIAQDAGIAPEVLDFLGIDHIAVTVDKSSPQLLQYIEAVFPLDLIDEWNGADWSDAPSTIRLYRVRSGGDAVATSSKTLSMSDVLSPLYLGEGWSTLPTSDGVRYATRAAPALLLDLPEEGARITLDLAALGAPLDATINGVPIAVEQDAANGQRAVIVAPPGVADQPVDRVQLHFRGEPAPAQSIVAPADPRGFQVGERDAFLAPGAAIVALSAGQDTGNFAHIYVNGVDVARNQRGYNLAAVDDRGNVLDSVAFDTFASPDASRRMAAWLTQWPTGTIIAGAVGDEASMNLGQDAIDALSSVGVTTDLRNRFRWGHAFVGATGGGDAPGALEATSLVAPVAVAVGSPVDGNLVYGGVRSIQIEPPRNPK